MLLTYLGNELDPNKQHKLISCDLDRKIDYGFKVTLKYKNCQDKEAILCNIEEIHNLFNNTHISFRSDILKGSFTVIINELDSVTVELANKVEENRYIIN